MPIQTFETSILIMFQIYHLWYWIISTVIIFEKGASKPRAFVDKSVHEYINEVWFDTIKKNRRRFNIIKFTPNKTKSDSVFLRDYVGRQNLAKRNFERCSTVVVQDGRTAEVRANTITLTALSSKTVIYGRKIPLTMLPIRSLEPYSRLCEYYGSRWRI